MSDIRTYVHPEGAPKMRVDRALAEKFKGEFSRSKLEESFKAGKVFVGGELVSKRFEIRAGDEVEIEMPELEPSEIFGADIPVEVLFEDEHIVVVNKPAGMTVHPGSGTGEDTLVHAMHFHTKGNLALASGAMRPGIVHRLDKETSGVMVMAKTDASYYALVEMFAERLVDKRYLALASGVPSVRSGSIRKSICRHPSFKTRMCVCDDYSGRDARTDWTLIEKYGAAACMISCKIFTGRTHQIRVHLSDAGFPIMGDYTYTFQKNKFKDIRPPERVMLHAHILEFDHPATGKRLKIEAPIPEDFAELRALLAKTYFEI